MSDESTIIQALREAKSLRQMRQAADLPLVGKLNPPSVTPWAPATTTWMGLAPARRWEILREASVAAALVAFRHRFGREVLDATRNSAIFSRLPEARAREDVLDLVDPMREREGTPDADLKLAVASVRDQLRDVKLSRDRDMLLWRALLVHCDHVALELPDLVGGASGAPTVALVRRAWTLLMVLLFGLEPLVSGETTTLREHRRGLLSFGPAVPPGVETVAQLREEWVVRLAKPFLEAIVASGWIEEFDEADGPDYADVLWSHFLLVLGRWATDRSAHGEVTVEFIEETSPLLATMIAGQAPGALRRSEQALGARQLNDLCRAFERGPLPWPFDRLAWLARQAGGGFWSKDTDVNLLRREPAREKVKAPWLDFLAGHRGGVYGTNDRD